MKNTPTQVWINQVVKPDQIERYLRRGHDFIDEANIKGLLLLKIRPEKEEIRAVITKSLNLQRLDPEDTAALLNCKDEDLWEEMYAAALAVKEKVFGPGIINFAPLCISNFCVNSCLYCGFRYENKARMRTLFNMHELQEEVKKLLRVGHERLLLICGEHPDSGVQYLADTLQNTYSTKVGSKEIRRVNVNAAPMSIEDFKLLKGSGIGTFQVLQETYHHSTYHKLHPRGVKSNYLWRLYCSHRALEAGVEDVGIGILFGLYDWRFEVLGLLAHTIDLVKQFGVAGPNTISFPRIEPHVNTPYAGKSSKNHYTYETFKKLVTVIRLSLPNTGLTLDIRNNSLTSENVIPMGISQLHGGQK